MQFVPSRTLIVAVAAAGCVAAVAGPLGGGDLALPAAAGLGLLALADVWLALRTAELPIVSLPPLVRLTHRRPGSVVVGLRASRPLSRPVRVALALPAAVRPELGEQTVRVEAAGAAQVEFECAPGQRGRFRGASACVESRSPGGLWLLRQRTVLGAEFRVYPNLLAEGREAAALFLPRHQAGIHAERMIGRGREFEKLREYLPGDGFDAVHWKASAKRSRPVTKVFQVERTQEILVVVDASRLSARPISWQGGTESALDRTLAAALALLTAAERQGDRFGLMAFDDRVRTFIPAGGGPAHYAACRDAALGLAPSETVPEVAEIVRFIRTRVRRRTLLFLLTDLADPVLAEDFLRQAPLLARQHLVVVGQLRAPEVAPLFSGAPVTAEGDLYDRLSRHIRWKELRLIARRLRPAGVGLVLLESETMAADLVRRYLEIKRRRAL